MVRYAVVSIAGGLLFGMMDGLINANPLALKLFEVYAPIARETVNVPAGVVIDLVYGFVMAGVFILLYRCLPGKSGLVKGISYAALLWFFRVVMYAVSQWMILNIPAAAVYYIAFTGLAEMAILGLFFGLTLKPTGGTGH
jgi:hypothetical protein